MSSLSPLQMPISRVGLTLANPRRGMKVSAEHPRAHSSASAALEEAWAKRVGWAEGVPGVAWTPSDGTLLLWVQECVGRVVY